MLSLRAMPFKTKRQKMAAVDRRFVFAETPVLRYGGDSGGKERQLVAEKGDRARNIQDLGYLGRDLAKILIFASTIIAAQITLALTLPS